MSKAGKMDTGLFVATLALLAVGIVMVYSASFVRAGDSYLISQVVRAFIAVACFSFFINFDYHNLGRYSHILLICAAVLLVYALTLPEINNVNRWIMVAGMQFQPSDFARVALVMFLAKKCDVKEADFSDRSVYIPIYVSIAVICALAAAGGDFSTPVIIAVTAFAIIFLVGFRVRHLLAYLGICAVTAVVLVWKVGYRLNRVLAHVRIFWLNHTPTSDEKRLLHQPEQSLIGLGNGGFLGTGLGKGEQKYFYLPEPHTDYIFTVLGEEFGFVGAVLVLLLFAFVVFRGFNISLNAPDSMGRIMAFGLTIMVALYALLHVAVTTTLVPTTGSTMPFLSFGGTSLIIVMSSMGVLLNISSHATSGTVSVSGRKRAGRR